MREREKSKVLRCAIYTRKSSEEGLEQDFNSLHAQREACEAYVLSQRHEGWKSLPTLYDDGGYSGGTMERPALKQLLSDIHGKKIDVVVVYKVDRLTRALTDFAKIVEVFDAQGVSFVSVTQQFNTTSSMGRLTLNVLLSFAQFEREVTGERIRDKIAASKKKGMWMGGVVPLGYDAKDRTLVINEPGAEIVRGIFRSYLELRSVNRLERNLVLRNIRTKRYVSAAGRVIGDKPFSRGHLYKFLTNPLYLGEIQHREIRHPGLHPAIIERETWDAVQAMLATNARDRRNGTSVAYPSLLSGLLFDEHGNRFIATHATKNGKRYRYYVCEVAAGPDSFAECDRTIRLPAGEFEQAVISSTIAALRDQHLLLEYLGPGCAESDTIRSALAEAGRLATEIEAGQPTNIKAILAKLVTRIDVKVRTFRLHLYPQAVMLLHPEVRERASNCGVEPLAVEGVFNCAKQSSGSTFVVARPDETGDYTVDMNPALLKAVARGFVWFEVLTSAKAGSMEEIALREGVTDRYVGRLVDQALSHFEGSSKFGTSG
jgi:site-specific DNA recombinase